MKPSTTPLDPESWRHDDANLRRAVQQWNGQLPTLPEGFAERMQQRMQAEGAASAPRHRKLWPWWSAAVAAVAVLAVVFLWPKADRTEQQVAQVVTQSGSNYQPSVTPNSQNNQPTAASNDPEERPGNPVTNHHRPKKAKATPRPDKPGKDAATPLTALTHLPVDDAVSPKNSVSATDPSKEKLWDSNSQTTQGNHQPSIAATVPEASASDSEAITLPHPQPSTPLPRTPISSSSHSRNLLALAVHITPTITAGLDNNVSNRWMQDTPHYNNYYFLAGNGYTYTYDVRAYTLSQSHLPNVMSHTDHSLPFTAAALVNIPLAKNLSLETGVTYTRLCSTFDSSNTYSYTHTRQRVHYLGLPLLLQLPLIQKKAWQLYGSTGVSVEIPVSATAVTTQYTPTNTLVNPREHLPAPVQIAPTAAIGLQVNLSHHVGLFVQPSMQLFPEFSSDVETYRTEHPLCFNLPFGLRWTL